MEWQKEDDGILMKEYSYYIVEFDLKNTQFLFQNWYFSIYEKVNIHKGRDDWNCHRIKEQYWLHGN